MPSEDRIARNEKHYIQMIKKLSVEQQMAVVDLALDLRPGWFRRRLLGLPLTADDESEQLALTSGLDAIAA
jgi:hypothetical protein